MNAEKTEVLGDMLKQQTGTPTQQTTGQFMEKDKSPGAQHVEKEVQQIMEEQSKKTTPRIEIIKPDDTQATAAKQAQSPEPKLLATRKDDEDFKSEMLSSAMSKNESSQHLQREPITLSKDIFDKLVKLHIISESDRQGMPELTLSPKQTNMFYNAEIFMLYLLTLRRLLKTKCNQDLNINPDKAKSLSQSCEKVDRLRNWEVVVAELDKIGIGVDEEILNLIVEEKREPIEKLFARMDRYMKIIAGVDFMKFENLQPEDFEGLYKPDPPLISQITNLTMEEMISVASHLIPNVQARQFNSVKQKSEDSSEFKSQAVDSRSGSFISKRPFPAQRNDMSDLPISREESEIASIIQKSRTQLNRKMTHISTRSNEASSPSKKGGNLLQHMFTQKEKGKTSNEFLNLVAQENIPEISESSERRTRLERVVKDGVDLISLDGNKPFKDLESSFELVLITLSKAFNLKPKQAAALLTNNNQYLVTACIKGAKGSNYEPILTWYNLLCEHAVLLADLLYFEAKQLPQTARQTFFKVMAALGCGFYSYNHDVVLTTFKLVHLLFEEFLQEPDMQATSMKWFFMNQTPEDGFSGLNLVLYAVKHHMESCGSFMRMLQLICATNEQLIVILKDELQLHTKSLNDYIVVVSDLLPALSKTFEEQLLSSGLLDFWVEMSSREAENDGKHTVEERIAALAVLTEVWLGFTEYVDTHEEMANTILFMLKRAVRERVKSIRIASSAMLFRILDSFGERKHKVAPMIFKSLIFALIENPSDLTARAFYLSNFQSLFEANKGIPVQLLVEPLFKQMAATLVNGQNLKIFDFDFFVFINSHPKFSASCALQLLELLGHVILGDLKQPLSQGKGTTASKPDEFKLLSYYTLAQVPFLQTCFACLLRATGDGAPSQDQQMCVSYIQRFLQSCIAKLFDLEPTPQDEALKQQLKRKENKFSPIAEKPKPEQKKARDLSKTSNKIEQETNRKLQKTFTIITILKIQNMLPPEADLNVELRKKTVEAQVEFKDLFGYENKGLTQILKYYGDPAQVIGRTLGQNQIAIRKSQLGKYGETQKSPYKNRSIDDGLSSSMENRAPVSQVQSSRENPQRPKQLYNLVSTDIGTLETESHALVPYKQPSSQKDSYNRSRPRQRALAEIDRIQRLKEERARASQEQEQKMREMSAKRRKLARDEVEKRKIELGIADKVVGIPAASLIQDSTEIEKRQPKTKQIALIDLNDDEEDRDTKPIKHMMTQYSKLWRNLFNKYQNAGFVAKKNKSIEEQHQQVPILTLAEINKMLRDHDTLPQLISKDELATVVRLINMKLDSSKPDLQSLNYAGFQQLIVQLSLICFTRPPRDMSGKPTFEHLMALINTFTMAVKSRGLSTLLYEEIEDPVQTKDKELIDMLTLKLKTEPDYPLPEGFTKVKELRPVVTYEVPAQTAAIIGEARSISITILDELCAELLGVHVLQSKVRLEEKFRIKPTFQRTPGKPESDVLDIMKKHENKQKLKAPSRGSQRPGLDSQQLDAKKEPSQEKVKLEPTPEEIQAQKAEAEAKKKKREEYAKLKAERDKREQDRQARKEEEREKKKAEEEAKRKKEEKLQALKIAEQKELKEKVQKFKQEREEKKKQEEDEKREAVDEEEEQKAEEREAFFAKQQEQFEKKLKSLKDDRIKKEQEQKLKEQKEKEMRDKLQGQVATHLEQGKIKRRKEQELANVMDEFLMRQDIAEVLNQNEKGISTLFKFYCKQQKHTTDEERPFLLLNMHYKIFTKFAYQSKIVPRLATVEDVNKTFRDIVRYYKQPDAKGPAADNSKFSMYIDQQMFVRALIRLALIGKDKEASTELEAATAEALQQLRDEFAKESAGNDQDFEKWLADKEAKGKGVQARIAQMKRFAGRRMRAPSVTKQSFVDVDINAITPFDLQNLCSMMGCNTYGEIDEKLLEERQKVPLENFGSTGKVNTLGRINIKQQTQPQMQADPKSPVITPIKAANESMQLKNEDLPKEWDNEIRDPSEMDLNREEDQTPLETQQQ